MMQSSAYVPLCEHSSLSNRGSLATRRATRYLGPSFSNSDSTHVVIHGIPIHPSVHFPQSGGVGEPTLGVETVHHTLDELDLVLQRKVDKVGIHYHAVRRAQLRVVLEEHG